MTRDRRRAAAGRPAALAVAVALAAALGLGCSAGVSGRPDEGGSDTGVDPADEAVEPPDDTVEPSEAGGEPEDTAVEPDPDVTAPEADGATMTPELSEACRVSGGYRWLPVPEASGAARLDPDGERIVIVADSGNAGRALVLDTLTWDATPATLAVDDGASDDLEGLARAPDGRIVGLTSAGWFREWTWDGETFTRTRSAYAGSTDPAWVCGRTRGNCGKNYEGLCLHPAPTVSACAGFAASKTAGLLVCVREADDGYRFDPTTLVVVVADVSGEVEEGPLSACSFEPHPPYRLVVGGNLFTGSAIWEVVGYDDPATARVVALPVMGAPNQEALELVTGGRMLSFGDVQSLSPDSPALEIVCR